MTTGEFAARVFIVVLALFVLVQATTIADRHERWHCERYLAGQK